MDKFEIFNLTQSSACQTLTKVSRKNEKTKADARNESLCLIKLMPVIGRTFLVRLSPTQSERVRDSNIVLLTL